MRKWDVLNTFFSTMSAVGAACLIGWATTQNSLSPILLYVGLPLILIGIGGFVFLLLRPERSRPEAQALESTPTTLIEVANNSGITTTNQSGGTNTQNINY